MLRSKAAVCPLHLCGCLKLWSFSTLIGSSFDTCKWPAFKVQSVLQKKRGIFLWSFAFSFKVSVAYCLCFAELFLALVFNKQVLPFQQHTLVLFIPQQKWGVSAQVIFTCCECVSKFKTKKTCTLGSYFTIKSEPAGLVSDGSHALAFCILNGVPKGSEKNTHNTTAQ